MKNILVVMLALVLVGCSCPPPEEPCEPVRPTPPGEVLGPVIPCQADADCGTTGACFRQFCDSGVCAIELAPEGSACEECGALGSCERGACIFGRMTCIVAQKTKTGVLMGADSSSTDGSRLIRRANPKLWNVSPRVAVGASGSCRMGDLLRTANNFPAPPEIWPFDPDEFALSLGRFFREIWKDEIGNRHGWALVAADHEIFYVGSDVSVIRVDAKYSALGSGELPALGALFCFEKVDRMEGRSDEPPWTEDARVRATIALDAACEHVEGLRGPYVFAETTAP